jgi:hypothetical protein
VIRIVAYSVEQLLRPAQLVRDALNKSASNKTARLVVILFAYCNAF